jgi:hypothetical protein
MQGYGQRWLLPGQIGGGAVYITREELDTMIAFAALVVSIIVATQGGGNKND